MMLMTVIVLTLTGGEMPEQPGGTVPKQGGVQQPVFPAIIAQAV